MGSQTGKVFMHVYAYASKRTRFCFEHCIIFLVGLPFRLPVDFGGNAHWGTR